MILPPAGRLAFFLAIILLIAPVLQASDLSLWGNVSDSRTGQPIAGAQVTVQPGGERLLTDQNGAFRFYYLQNDLVDIEVTADGFRTANVEDVKLQRDVADRVDIQLQQILYWQDDQTVTAEKLEDNSNKTVIGRESPEFESARTLSDILEFSTEIIVNSSGGSNRSASVSIAGAPAKQTGVFIDGVRVNSNLNGEFDINSIPLKSVEKIEIYSGSSGGQFGVGALAGAVNIITRKAVLKGKAEINQKAASLNSHFTDLNVENRFSDKLSGVFSYSRSTSSNDFDYDDPKTGPTKRENNYRDTESYYLNANYNLSEQNKIALSFSDFYSESGLPGAIYQLTATAANNEYTRRWHLSSEHSFSRKFHLNISGHHILSTLHFSDYDSFIPYNSKYHDSRFTLALNPRILLDGNHNIHIRTVIEHDQFRQFNLMTEDADVISVDETRLQNTAGLKASYNLKNSFPIVDRLHLDLFMTQIASKLYSPLVSPLIRIGLQKGEAVVIGLSASYGNSYRAPIYSSLFWSEDAFSVGNPNLRPEKSEDFSLESSVSFSWGGRWKFGVAYDHSYIRDLIYWERRFDGKYMPYNMNAAVVSSLHWSARWNLARGLGQISLNYTLSDPRDRSWQPNVHDMLLTFRPRKMTDFNCLINPGPFQLGLNMRWVSERYIRRANTKFLQPYQLTSAYAGFQQKLGAFDLNIDLRIDNLFSEEYEILERYPQPTRTYSIGFGLTYNYSKGD